MMDNNKIASDNLSNNEVASGNFSQNTLASFDGVFNGLEKTVALFFPSVRNAMVERYRAETTLKIGIMAQEIIEQRGLEIKPIPPKAALPLFDKLSLEHEKEMYDVWAKLLVGAATDYSPIQVQYAEILSKIGSNEARLLKNIFDFQAPMFDRETEVLFNQDRDIEKNNLIRMNLSEFMKIDVVEPTNYKQDEWEPAEIRTEIKGLTGLEEKPDYHYLYKIYGKDNNCPLEDLITGQDFNSLELLVSLGLIKYEYIWQLPEYMEDKKTHIRMFLTSFGYSFVLSLEICN